jgi:hypothetical protein
LNALEIFVARTPVKGEFTPANARKYIGKYPIIYRSSWELTMMRKFDEHPNVIAWASETVSIPYQNPLTGKWSMYIPDFLVVYQDKNGMKRAEIIEVKPLKERPDYQRKQGERLSERTKLAQAINAAKWTAAVKFCAKNHLSFRVASEDEMFAYRRKK